MSRRSAYLVLAAWTVGVVAGTSYVLPAATDSPIRTIKIGLGIWVAGVAALAGFLTWRSSDFFKE